MANLISLTFQCGVCGHYWHDTIERVDREAGRLPPCPICEAGQTTILMSAPKVLQKTFPDGTRRLGFTEMKRALDLEIELRDKDYKKDDKRRIRQEIKKLKEIK